MKKMIALIMALTMAFSTTMVFANSTVFEYQNGLSNPITFSRTINTRSVGLAWGPVRIGNLEFKITNNHKGEVVGMPGEVEHVNFHVMKVKNKRDVLNYHIVKYRDGDSECVYVYDSVTKKVIINQCFRSWTDAAKDVVRAAKTTVQSMLSQADWIATAAIWALVIVAIATAISAVTTVVAVPV